ncbi:hypothetical protein STRDD10_00844 [Streptococcus sp. DD10]|nr:hypothetical protein STRDD10_00844 [Streptococcus sp. DD10]
MSVLTAKILKKEADDSAPLRSMLFIYPLQLTKILLNTQQEY